MKAEGINMNTQGYIKVHRSITLNELWNEPFDKARAWIDLIMMANYNGDTTTIDKQVIEIPRGHLITSIRILSDRWKWSTTKTLAFIKLLEIKNRIVTKKIQKKYSIEIVNYELYQGNEKQKSNEKNTKKLKNDTLLSKYVLRNKEIKEYIYAHFEEFWLMYPKKTGKQNAKKVFTQILTKEKEIFPSIKEGLEKYISYALPSDPKFIPYPATWLNQRRWEDEVEVKSTRMVNCINPNNPNEVILTNGSIYAKTYCVLINGEWRRR